MFKLVSSLVVLLFFISCVLADEPQCGRDVGGAFCLPGYCCSKEGFCGTTEPYCRCGGCQSGPCDCPTPPSPDDISSIIGPDLFDEMLKHRNDDACHAKGFYTYDAFLAAAKSFTEFGNTGGPEIRKREIAAFLAQTSHATTGGWPTLPDYDSPDTWGYCFKDYKPVGVSETYHCCVESEEWPCAPGKSYCGRGPIQITHNTNYGPAGANISYDLLNDPEAVATDPVISFQTALWFWMTPQSTKPSCHDVVVGLWSPSIADMDAGRLPGYGVTINIINGAKECGKHSTPSSGLDRIGFYKRYCDLLNVEYEHNLNCDYQQPFETYSLGNHAAA